MNDTHPTQDERVMAALAHACIMLFGTGIIAVVVLWVTQKDRSRYVAFQALQAMVYQVIGFFVFLVAMCSWLTLYLLSLIPLMAAAEKAASEPPLYFLVSLVLMVVPFALMGIWILGGLWGAVRTLQAREFRYLVLGNQLERWLASS
jgi:uncharacterized Tic20 family protein